MFPSQYLTPQWPAPKSVQAAMSTRIDGFSDGIYHAFNLGRHCGDESAQVDQNRAKLRADLALPNEPAWLKQTHSTIAVAAESVQLTPHANKDHTKDHAALEADASYTSQHGVVCCVMTADCLPVLICNKQGTEVAAIHAGWRGLADGVIESTVESLQSKPEDLLLWFGAAIGPDAFEVGEEVIAQFQRLDANARQAFIPHPQHADKWLGDLYTLAKHRCDKLGIARESIYSDYLCTYSDPARFYSYRRERQTGRMASLIWLI